MKLNEAYWSDRYVKGTSFWDTGEITPPLKDYFLQLHRKDISILIPGCGNAHEAEFLLQQGFTNITLVDISEVLCNQLVSKFQHYKVKSLQVICADFFSHVGQYDLVVEQTFFCALAPSLRKAYAEHLSTLLKPGGKLVGVLFNAEFEESPPFGGNENSYRGLFEKKFNIEVMAPCYNSITPRMNRELFVKLSLKSSG
jgi:SAM-dependent methyltransferase